ncbi:MAG: hypothetical protein Q9199_001221 [Rusavskia elegans]
MGIVPSSQGSIIGPPPTQRAALAMGILPSSNTYGPDGPWQTVNVSIGDPQQFVQLLPGGYWASVILSPDICKDNTRAQICGTSGLYDPADSNTVDEESIKITLPNVESLDGGQSQANVSVRQIMDTLQIPRISFSPFVVQNFSIRLLGRGSMILPDGSAGYPPHVGNLALGAPNIKHSFARDDGQPNVNASLIPSALKISGDISTNSFGLHIGSVAMGIPLSLWLGGYDSSRVLGPVSSQPYFQDPCITDLLDIGIGVDNGASPFPFPEKQGILRQGNGSMDDSIQVSLNPLAPYLHLPQSTCDAIASYLPVSYQNEYKLYFWNTQDPRYEPLVKSPAYLSFTFRATSLPQAKLTIKVPFQLLNLTLRAPMIDTPTQYFPCQSPQADGRTASLGRAFLQAAFIGINWDADNAEWWLAQAPGPDTGRTPQQEQFSNPFRSSTATWSDSWKGHWTPLRETISTVNSTSPSITSDAAAPNAGLSTGAKAGIGVGCAAAVVALVAGLSLLCFRRSRSRARMAAEQSLQEDARNAKKIKEEDLKRADIPSMVEAADPEPVELTHREMYQELPATPPLPPPKSR